MQEEIRRQAEGPVPQELRGYVGGFVLALGSMHRWLCSQTSQLGFNTEGKSEGDYFVSASQLFDGQPSGELTRMSTEFVTRDEDIQNGNYDAPFESMQCSIVEQAPEVDNLFLDKLDEACVATGQEVAAGKAEPAAESVLRLLEKLSPKMTLENGKVVASYAEHMLVARRGSSIKLVSMADLIAELSGDVVFQEKLMQIERRHIDGWRPGVRSF